MKLFSIALFSLFLVSGAFAAAPIETKVYQFSASAQASITVKYFAHNNPSVREFVEGKAKVEAALANFSESKFTPKVKSLSVGIAPNRMNGGDVLVEGGVLFVAATASAEQCEGGLSAFFELQETADGIRYFGHNHPSLAEFNAGKANVQKAIGNFRDNGLTLVLPKGFQVGIAPNRMNGGEVVEEKSRLYVSSRAAVEDIERFFTKYIQQ